MRLMSVELTRHFAVLLDKRRNCGGEGGDQERILARQARDWAEAMPHYSRTAALLMRVSENWLREAEQAHLSAEKESLRR
jgi:hypothetical protein